MNCPLCGAQCVYAGVVGFECKGQGCANYYLGPSPEVRAVWVALSAFSNIPALFWTSESHIDYGTPVTHVGDDTTVRKACGTDPVIGSCVFFGRYYTREEAIQEFSEYNSV